MPLYKDKSRKYSTNAPIVFVMPAATAVTDATAIDANTTAGIVAPAIYDATDNRWEYETGAIGATTDFIIWQNKGLDLYSNSTFVKTGTINRAWVKATKEAYSAAVRQVTHVGWFTVLTNGNGATGSGSMNIASVAVGDEYFLHIEDTTALSTPYVKHTFAYTAVTGDTEYLVTSNLAEAISDESNPEWNTLGKRKYRALLKHNIAISAGNDLANTLLLTKGSINVTSVAHALDALDYVDILGDTYQVITAPTADTFTLDRVYTGASAAASPATTSYDLGATAPTEVGIEIVSEFDGDTFKVARAGDLATATLDYTTVYTLGSGSYDEVRELERRGNIHWGDVFQNDEAVARYDRQRPNLYASSTLFYTIYQLTDLRRDVLNGQKRIDIRICVPQADASTVATLFDTEFGL